MKFSKDLPLHYYIYRIKDDILEQILEADIDNSLAIQILYECIDDLSENVMSKT